MQMTSLVDMLLGLVAAAGAWWMSETSKEQKRIVLFRGVLLERGRSL